MAASALGRMLAQCPAVGGSPSTERVDVHTPDHQFPCIAGLSVRQETAGYAIDMHESEFSEATAALIGKESALIPGPVREQQDILGHRLRPHASFKVTTRFRDRFIIIFRGPELANIISEGVLRGGRRSKPRDSARPHSYRHSDGKWVRVCRGELCVADQGREKDHGSALVGSALLWIARSSYRASEQWGA